MTRRMAKKNLRYNFILLLCTCNDEACVPLQEFPVAVATCSGEKSVSVKLIQSEDTEKWMSDLLKRAKEGGSIAVNIYPETFLAPVTSMQRDL